MGRSRPVMTQRTPGKASAFEVSMLLMSACCSWLRRSLQKSMRGRTMSSANLVCPVHLLRASTLRKGLPTTCSGFFFPGLSFAWFPFLFVPINTLFWQLSLFPAHACGGHLDRLVDFNIARTATQIAAQGFFDLVAVGPGVVLQEFFGDEQESGRAIAALGRARVRERVLQRMKTTILRHPFDRLDASVFRVETEHQTGENAPAIQEHGACAALAKLAAMLRAHQPEVFTQDFEQRLVRRKGIVAMSITGKTGKLVASFPVEH